MTTCCTLDNYSGRHNSDLTQINLNVFLNLDRNCHFNTIQLNRDCQVLFKLNRNIDLNRHLQVIGQAVHDEGCIHV